MRVAGLRKPPEVEHDLEQGIRIFHRQLTAYPLGKHSEEEIEIVGGLDPGDGARVGNSRHGRHEKIVPRKLPKVEGDRAKPGGIVSRDVSMF